MSFALCITGRVERALELTFEQLASLHDGQVPDVSELEPSRRGSAVRLNALLSAAGVPADAQHLSIRSQDGFEAQIPLAAVRDQAVLIYGMEGKQLPDKFGGPVRFLVPNAATCGADVVDTCANVKHVVCLELS